LVLTLFADDLIRGRRTYGYAPSAMTLILDTSSNSNTEVDILCKDLFLHFFSILMITEFPLCFFIQDHYHNRHYLRYSHHHHLPLMPLGVMGKGTLWSSARCMALIFVIPCGSTISLISSIYLLLGCPLVLTLDLLWYSSCTSS
jgi:hypothetical protein